MSDDLALLAKNGERQLRSSMVQLVELSTTLRNAVLHGKAEMSKEALAKTEAAIEVNEKAASFVAQALRHLPDDIPERVAIIAGHLESLAFLVEDERLDSAIRKRRI